MTEKSHIEIWANCLNIIKSNVSHQNFKTWFKPIIPISVKKNILTIQVPSVFFYEWLEGTSFWESPTLEISTTEENKKAYKEFLDGKNIQRKGI